MVDDVIAQTEGDDFDYRHDDQKQIFEVLRKIDLPCQDGGQEEHHPIVDEAARKPARQEDDRLLDVLGLE